LASIHNLTFYLNLIREAREHIKNDTFFDWKEITIKNLTNNIKINSEEL